MAIPGFLVQQLVNALLEGFPSYANLDMMVRIRCDRSLAAMAGGPAQPLTDVAFTLIRAADAQGWLLRLMIGSVQEVPGNPDLRKAARTLANYVTELRQRSPEDEWAYEAAAGAELAMRGAPVGATLQGWVNRANGFLDINGWRSALTAIEFQVCRVLVGDEGRGTGFLVGPDLVLTNHHVLKPVFDGEVAAEDVELQFDYKVLDGSQVLNRGTLFKLQRAAGGAPRAWLVAASPPSELDDAPLLEPAIPAGELDYALLRVDGAPGDAPRGGTAAAPPRGWLPPRARPHSFTAGTPLFIVQHPMGEPLRLALDSEAVLGMNTLRTRVRYRTNTMAGSSGSPCFNERWELVALHHAGEATYKPRYNQGIPIDAIVADLSSKRIALPPLPRDKVVAGHD